MAEEALPPNDAATRVSRVLVVDDDPDINRLLRARLAALGYRVEAAANGEEALAQLAATPPDLMFLDVAMPGIGGLEVLEQVRAQAADLAVIMTTAFGSEAVAIEALRHGADDYLRKPFERQEFQAVLERAVARLELRRRNVVLQRQLDEKRRQLEAELARAAQVQAELLPRDVPALPGFDLAARCLPARDVGGDFYDWQEITPGVVSLTVGDVMGKGMPAALLMATVRATLRAVARQNPPAAALELAGRALETDFERTGSFVTLFHAQLDVGARRLRYVDAGHSHVFVCRAHGAAEELKRGGRPLGVPSQQGYEEGTVTFRAGDALVVYSDGLLEAWSDRDPLALTDQCRGATSAAHVVERLVGFAALTGAPPDDLTVVVLRCSDER
jgi:serine phosphatase RsbU (regulator of sigma subunit)